MSSNEDCKIEGLFSNTDHIANINKFGLNKNCIKDFSYIGIKDFD